MLPGLLNASKGDAHPLVCWIMVTASSRHRFTWFGTLGLVAVLFVAWGFVYPFAQNARYEVRDAELLSDKAAMVVQFIRDPTRFPTTLRLLGNPTNLESRPRRSISSSAIPNF